MKKIIGLTLLTLTTSSYSTLPKIDFDNLSGTFDGKRGRLSATYGEYSIPTATVSHGQLEMKVDRAAKKIFVTDSNTNVELRTDLDFLEPLQKLSLNKLYVDSLKDKFTLTIENAGVALDDEVYNIKQFGVTSTITGTNVTSILKGITEESSFLIEEVNFGKSSKAIFIADMMEENREKKAELLKKTTKGIKIPVVIRNAKLVVKKETFVSSVKLDSWINGTLRLGGKMVFDETKNKLQIKLLKAKLGIFSLRKLILKQVRKMKNKNISVSGNTISISFQKKD